MKTQALHQLIQQNIPHITFIDDEITDMIEGECTLWQQDCAIVLDLGKQASNEAILKQIAQQLDQLNQQQNKLLQDVQQNSTWLPENIEVAYLAFTLDNGALIGDLALIEQDNDEDEAIFSLENPVDGWQFVDIEAV
ncbi:hypothetical protein ACKLNO_04145 [Neisseriaceae bacterium B1]